MERLSTGGTRAHAGHIRRVFYPRLVRVVGIDPRGALSIGQVRGALLVACADAGFACVEYPPAQVKQAVCGHGRADKQQVQRMAKTLLGLASTPTPTHAADALA